MRRVLMALSFAMVGVFGSVDLVPQAANGAGDAQACIDALRHDRAAAWTSSDHWGAMWNSTLSSSALGKLRLQDRKLVDEANTDYYTAYLRALAGNKSSARTWAAKGDAAIKKANAVVVKINAEIARLNGLVDKYNDADDLATADARVTDITCTGF
jgi:hypothetical protein